MAITIEPTRGTPPMDFPIAGLMDEDARYAKLLSILLPDGLACPRGESADRQSLDRPLAGASVGVRAISTFDTDHLLNRGDGMDRAIAALMVDGRVVREPTRKAAGDLAGDETIPGGPGLRVLGALGPLELGAA